MWSLLLGLVSCLGSGPADKIIGYLQSKQDAQTESEKLQTQVTIEQIRAEVQARANAKEMVIAEQGHWYTSIIRPLLALPIIIYLWKVVVWDIVLNLGTTDPIRGDVGQWASMIIATYVGGRTIEKVASIVSNRRR